MNNWGILKIGDDFMWLSKSRYCKGIQCPKMLWLDDNRPDLAEDVVPQNIVETGTEVGELAREYFGEYKLVEFSLGKNKMVECTRSLMSNHESNIAEASFMYESLYCAVDILHKAQNG